MGNFAAYRENIRYVGYSPPVIAGPKPKGTEGTLMERTLPPTAEELTRIADLPLQTRAGDESLNTHLPVIADPRRKGIEGAAVEGTLPPITHRPRSLTGLAVIDSHET